LAFNFCIISSRAIGTLKATSGCEETADFVAIPNISEYLEALLVRIAWFVGELEFSAFRDE